jgi:hypothetical protein
VLSFARPSFARPSSTRCGHAGFVPDAIFLCRAVDHPRAVRRGNRSADSNSTLSIRPTRGPSAIGATISGGRGRASGRADMPPLQANIILRAGIIPASLLLRTPLGEAGEQSHQAREQVPHQQTQRPRARRRTQFFHQDG